MRKHRPDFSGPGSPQSKFHESWYDLVYDRDLIVATFASQYGIRLDQEEMPYGEFRKLLVGIMPDTPLGKIVAIRQESRKEVLKQYGPHEHHIRREWRKFQSDRVPDEVKKASVEQLQKQLSQMFT